MKFSHILTTIILSCGLGMAMPVLADESATDIDPKIYEQADFYINKRLAEQGDANSQLNLGVIYAKGKGVKQDYAQAVKWFTKAAEQGNETAQYNLGLMYVDGKGVKKDNAKAAKWFTKAAEQGLVDAQHNIAVMYSTGQGVRQDKSIAKKWYSKTCNAGIQEDCNSYNKLDQQGH